MLSVRLLLVLVVAVAADAAQNAKPLSDWEAIALGSGVRHVREHFAGRIVADTRNQFRVSASIFDRATQVDILFRSDRVQTAIVWFTNAGTPVTDRLRLYEEIRERLPKSDECPQSAVRLNGRLLFGAVGLSSSRCEFVYQIFEGHTGYRLSLASDSMDTLESAAEIGLSLFSEEKLVSDGAARKRANQSPEPTAMSVTPPAAQEPRQP